jgi:phytoene dehydrogenase-like protein
MAGERERVVVIGAGVNGLTAAAYLSKAGFAPLVLERRSIVGGTAVTEEFHPGYRSSSVAQSAAWLPRIVGDLGLGGVKFLRSEVRVFAPSRDGRALLLFDDPKRTASELSRFSEKDARRWAEFHESLGRLGRFLQKLLCATPPSPDKPTAQDIFGLLKAGRGFRSLPRKDAWRLLRWGPMAVADFAGEWFDTEPLRATLAARGIHGMSAGPRSGGTTANLLLRAAFDPHSAGPGAFVQGGMGALSAALSATARAAGAEIRTQAEVVRVTTRGGRASGVALSSGEEIRARAVVSSADPKRTFLGLLDPMELDPDFSAKIRNYRSTGMVAKVHLALSGLPEFPALGNAADGRAALSGRIHVGDDIDDLERAFDAAKYGSFSERPWCEATIPTVADPSLAPPGGHVMSVHVQYAPYRLREGDWVSRREALGDAVVSTLGSVCPGLPGLIVARKVVTPLDLEQTYGLTGGHIFHGEHALDQLYAARPLLGWARYRTPVEGLYLCGAGTHPGGGITGAPGANASREILKDLKR